MSLARPIDWGLRDYETEPLDWGGDAGCEHEWGDTAPRRRRSPDDVKDPTSKQATNRGANCELVHSATCQKCGAWRGHYGNEPTVQMYVEHTVEILRAIKRVLRKDGLVWWNIADSRATHHSKRSGQFGKPIIKGSDDIFTRKRPTAASMGLKEKDLCLIPQRVAIAAQEDGWWLSSDIPSVIIWDKPNPMPESVRDRPSKSYEQILMLAHPDCKGRWYYDQEAERQIYAPNSSERYAYDFGGNKNIEMAGTEKGRTKVIGDREPNPNGANLRDVWRFPTGGFSGEYCTACGAYYEGGEQRQLPYREGEKGEKIYRCRCGRDDAWVGHFATFPIELPLRCIKLATSEWGQCPKCGKPWGRDVERETVNKEGWGRSTKQHHLTPQSAMREGQGRCGDTVSSTTGWSPRCKCDAGEPVPQTVLDPFSGAATTGLAAQRLQRKYIGIELNPHYAAMSEKRMARADAPLFDEGEDI